LGKASTSLREKRSGRNGGDRWGKKGGGPNSASTSDCATKKEKNNIHLHSVLNSVKSESLRLNLKAEGTKAIAETRVYTEQGGGAA